MTIITDPLNPYSDMIKSFALVNFTQTTIKDKHILLDALTDAIVATGQTRVGPKPSPESLTSMREVITSYTASNRPIPFLAPWGSEKPDGSSVDVAELAALKTLMCLEKRVKSVYEPGIKVNIRLEDVSAPHLFYERPDEARRDAEVYSSAFVNVVSLLNLKFIEPVRETSMASEERFNSYANAALEDLEHHLHGAPITANLKELGWKGEVDKETIAHYLATYEKLYPNESSGAHIHRLARYFAGSLARRELGIMGADPEWLGNYLELSFAPPTPGFSRSRLNRRLFYRTIPSGITSNHIPPWRAKGYLKIEDDVVKPALASFNDKGIEFNKAFITLVDDNTRTEQKVQTDFVLL